VQRPAGKASDERISEPIARGGRIENLVQVRLGPTFDVAIKWRSLVCLLTAGSIEELHHVRSGTGYTARAAMRFWTLEWARKGWRIQHSISS